MPQPVAVARALFDALREALLCCLLVVDVGVGTDPAHRRAAFASFADVAVAVLHRMGAHQMPTVVAVEPTKPKLRRVGQLRRKRKLPLRDDIGQVVWMDDRRPAVAFELLEVHAGVLIDLVVEPVEPAVSCCGPDLVGHCLGQRTKAALALAQRRFDLLGPCDVLHHAAQQHRLAGVVANQFGMPCDPAQRLIVGAANAVFDIEAQRAIDAVRERRHGLYGVDAQGVDDRGLEFRPHRHAEDATELCRHAQFVGRDVEQEDADATRRLRQSQLLVSLAQRLFGELAAVDVDHHARKAQGPVHCVVFYVAAGLHP